ncbi:MAG: hypothetical protein IPL22_13935 [Bacteroidetes bacterium]|nr:hypothetical protein [Bacteroidota bacterium]
MNQEFQTMLRDKYCLIAFYSRELTGKGTGLGLSLSYDIIVKGHGEKQ